MTASNVVRTPADLTVIATCPTCEQPTAIRMQVGAELLVTDDGSELRIKGKSKGVAHICDQLPMNLESDIADRVLTAVMDAAEDPASEAARPLREMAERTGTSITIEAQGRSVRVGDHLVDQETGEILESPETADERLRRLELEPDYVDRLGTDEGQALLEAAGREADEQRRKAVRS